MLTAPERQVNSQSTSLETFRRHVNRKYELDLRDYFQLHKWSVDNLEDFHQEVWEFCGIISSKGPKAVGNGLDKMWPRPQWYPGARLNFAENLLHVGLATHPDAVAISACRDGATRWRYFTWRQLELETARYASALRKAGIREGDRVAAVLTNCPEALFVMLATASIGAIFTATAPDMGTQGIVERFVQIQPKIIFAETEVTYGGKRRDFRAKIAAALKDLRAQNVNIERLVLVQGIPWKDTALCTLSAFLDVPIQPLEFAQLPFDQPLFILYSSGTTGAPKCNFELLSTLNTSIGRDGANNIKIDLLLGMDLGRNSVFYQYTTTGWMMWNVLVGALSVGASIVMYDGSPLYPSTTTQLEVIQTQGVTHWGTGPKFLLSLMQKLDKPDPKLESLQMIVTAGAPLPLEASNWLSSALAPQAVLNNGSGGTDMLGCIIGGGTSLKAHGNELAAPSLGMDVQVWDDEGRSIVNTTEKGELVITKPFVSMPTSFWGTNGAEKYRKAYFDLYPGVWAHGDFVSKNPSTQGYTIHGRSDGVLNPGGVRFGSAELYNILAKFPEVEDCLVVGQRRPSDADEQVLLFTKMKNGVELGVDLQTKICNTIRTSLSARHVPAFVLQVKNIPYTSNGKRIEHVVKSLVSGQKPKVGNSIANPECLAEYVQFQNLPKVENRSRL